VTRPRKKEHAQRNNSTKVKVKIFLIFPGKVFTERSNGGKEISHKKLTFTCNEKGEPNPAALNANFTVNK
jgi:hypothetical protein